MKSARSKAWLSLGVMIIIMAAVIFVPAGTLDYREAWLFLFVFAAGSAVTTEYLARRDPALLERRLRAGPVAEKQPTQRVIMVLASVGFLSLVIVPALDHRYNWSRVPAWIAIVGDILVAVGFFLVARVYRENTYASATVEVATGQRVISTGPYGIVRHPMYASALLYLLGIPLALASWWGLLGIVAMLPVLMWRLLDEERLLARELPGYNEYRQRVRYRLVPYVW